MPPTLVIKSIALGTKNISTDAFAAAYLYIPVSNYIHKLYLHMIGLVLFKY